LKKNHTVGYLGDGVNDVPALQTAHVAVSVQGANAIAQDASDLILLKKNLHALVIGIYEGRRIFVNTAKYIKTTITASIGLFYAMALTFVLLNYMPIAPLQILFLNIITDIPLIAIATDFVEIDELKLPKQHNIKSIALFSTILGMCLFVMNSLFIINSLAQQAATVQTNCYAFALLSECMLLFSVRTRKPLYKAHHISWQQALAFVLADGIGIAMIYLPFGHRYLNFTSLGFAQWRSIFFFLIGTCIVVEIVKHWYYRHLSPRMKPASK
jgi:P-type Mg2+ transporter